MRRMFDAARTRARPVAPVVDWHNIQPETGFPAGQPGIVRTFEVCVTGDLVVGWHCPAQQVIQRIPFSRLEVGRN